MTSTCSALLWSLASTVSYHIHARVRSDHASYASLTAPRHLFHARIRQGNLTRVTAQCMKSDGSCTAPTATGDNAEMPGLMMGVSNVVGVELDHIEPFSPIAQHRFRASWMRLTVSDMSSEGHELTRQTPSTRQRLPTSLRLVTVSIR